MTSTLSSARIETLVKGVLSELFDVPPETVTNGAFLRDLGLDSVMVLDVMLEVEDRLGIKLKSLAMPRNPKFSEIVARIERSMAAKHWLKA